MGGTEGSTKHFKQRSNNQAAQKFQGPQELRRPRGLRVGGIQGRYTREAAVGQSRLCEHKQARWHRCCCCEGGSSVREPSLYPDRPGTLHEVRAAAVYYTAVGTLQQGLRKRLLPTWNATRQVMPSWSGAQPRRPCHR